MVTLEERIDKAIQLRKQGYNCAQCVAMAYDEELANVTAGLGSGVGGTGNICGAANAMATVCGEMTDAAPTDKPAYYTCVSNMIEKFRVANNGNINCRDLRKPGSKTCVDLIKDAVRILHEEGF